MGQKQRADYKKASRMYRSDKEIMLVFKGQRLPSCCGHSPPKHTAVAEPERLSAFGRYAVII